MRDRSTAGRPALRRREPGQVRKEAATATHCKCRGNGSPPLPGLSRRTSRVAALAIERPTPAPHPQRRGPMTYQVLARKWRPKTFAELVGQAHVVQALT